MGKLLEMRENVFSDYKLIITMNFHNVLRILPNSIHTLNVGPNGTSET